MRPGTWPHHCATWHEKGPRRIGALRMGRRSARAVLQGSSTSLQPNLCKFKSISSTPHAHRVIEESPDALVTAVARESADALTTGPLSRAAGVIVVNVHPTLPLQGFPEVDTAEVAAAILFIEQLLPALFGHAVLAVVRIRLNPATRVLTIALRVIDAPLTGVLLVVGTLGFCFLPGEAPRPVVLSARTALRTTTSKGALLEGCMPLAGAARLALRRLMPCAGTAGLTLLALNHALILQDHHRVWS